MSEPTEQVTAMPRESPTLSETREPQALSMHALFRDHYLRLARFREDGQLVDELTREAEPALEALLTAFAPGEGPRALHEGYALLNLLARRAAALGATPSVALALPSAIALALRAAGGEVDSACEQELVIVCLEGYSAARDERVTGELRQAIASRQVAIKLGPRCIGIYLAGSHEEAELSPTLERLARELLRGDARSCLLDVSRLDPIDDELARALGRFCGHAATLGVCTFVFGASTTLREQFGRWSVATVAAFVDDYELAHTQALAAAGLSLRARRNWARLFFPTRGAMVR